jgi:hypothetical protein
VVRLCAASCEVHFIRLQVHLGVCQVHLRGGHRRILHQLHLGAPAPPQAHLSTTGAPASMALPTLRAPPACYVLVACMDWMLAITIRNSGGDPLIVPIGADDVVEVRKNTFANDARAFLLRVDRKYMQKIVDACMLFCGFTVWYES